MFSKLLCGVLLLWASVASAMVPEGGVWWNPDESGSGYVIEIQNNVLSISAYSYEPGGAATWYTSAGTMTGDNRYFGTLDKLVGGQCITCGYRAPTRSTAGTIELQFDSASTATLVINGTRTTRIRRTVFGINSASPYPLMGEWAFVEGSAAFPVYYGERMEFGGIYNADSGSAYASGSRTGSPSNIALGRLDSSGNWGILLDSSESYYEFFLFTFSGINVMEGRLWTYRKDSTPSGGGLPFIAFRSGSAVAASTGSGPALPRSQALPVAVIDYEATSLTKSQLQTGRLPAGDDLRGLEEARRALQQMLGK